MPVEQVIVFAACNRPWEGDRQAVEPCSGEWEVGPPAAKMEHYTELWANKHGSLPTLTPSASGSQGWAPFRKNPHPKPSRKPMS